MNVKLRRFGHTSLDALLLSAWMTSVRITQKTMNASKQSIMCMNCRQTRHHSLRSEPSPTPRVSSESIVLLSTNNDSDHENALTFVESGISCQTCNASELYILLLTRNVLKAKLTRMKLVTQISKPCTLHKLINL